MAIHSSILAWRILWIEELGELQLMGHIESDRTEPLSLSTHCTPYIYTVICRLHFFFFRQSTQLARPSFLTRGQTWAPAVKVWSPNHWTAREFPNYISIEKKKKGVESCLIVLGYSLFPIFMPFDVWLCDCLKILFWGGLLLFLKYIMFIVLD